MHAVEEWLAIIIYSVVFNPIAAYYLAKRLAEALPSITVIALALRSVRRPAVKVPYEEMLATCSGRFPVLASKCRAI